MLHESIVAHGSAIPQYGENTPFSAANSYGAHANEGLLHIYYITLIVYSHIKGQFININIFSTYNNFTHYRWLVVEVDLLLVPWEEE